MIKGEWSCIEVKVESEEEMRSKLGSSDYCMSGWTLLQDQDNDSRNTVVSASGDLVLDT